MAEFPPSSAGGSMSQMWFAANILSAFTTQPRILTQAEGGPSKNESCGSERADVLRNAPVGPTTGAFSGEGAASSDTKVPKRWRCSATGVVARLPTNPSRD